MNINHEINKLVQYAIRKLIIEEEDYFYVANKVCDLLNLTSFAFEPINQSIELHETLNHILDYAYENSIISMNDETNRDLLDAKIMDIFVSKPSEIIKRFYQEYKINSTLATDHYYQFCQDINYIRMDRIKKNINWKSKNEFGMLDMSINLSKPEKDPKTIAMAKLVKSTGYPKCLLCKENVGFSGGLNHPARQNHRIIPIKINQEKFYFQYSPYIYYNEHAIVLMDEHIDMDVTDKTFKRLTDFVDLFPGYFLGSNAGLPIVGGSILNHEHYQGGKYHFPIEDAKSIVSYIHPDFPECTMEVLYWPTSTVRIKSMINSHIWDLSTMIYQKWTDYEDEEAGIIPFTGSTPHNAITPICRKRSGVYEMDMVLRNNRTNQDFPDGVFHPHPETHHIKKENIGLIEVMGLAILPGRLKLELESIKEYVVHQTTLPKDCHYHQNWAIELKAKWNKKTPIDQFIQDEVGNKFLQAIQDAGVYKQTPDGLNQFNKFMEHCGFKIQ